ncbi:hypothetical protein HaLaN_26422, partial [Haematococcus lacustris]
MQTCLHARRTGTPVRVTLRNPALNPERRTIPSDYTMSSEKPVSMGLLSEAAAMVLEKGYTLIPSEALESGTHGLDMTTTLIIGAMHPRNTVTLPDQPFRWLVRYPPGWFGNFWVGVVVACLNLDASKYLPTNAELDVYIRKQKKELKRIGKDVDVFHELEKQHEACRANFSDLYGAELPKELQPVVTLTEEYIAKGGSDLAKKYQQAARLVLNKIVQVAHPSKQPLLEFELEGMTQAAPTQQQTQVQMRPILRVPKLVATQMETVCVDTLLARDFHTNPSEAEVRFNLSKSLMNDTLDVLVTATGNMRVGHVPYRVSVMMQMDPAWHPEGICGVQRLEGAVPGADWAAIKKATRPDNPIMLFQGMQSFAEADIVLMPLYYYSHFIVVVFFVAAGCIVHFDSINKGRFKVSTAQEAVLMEFAKRFIINKKWEVQQGSTEQQKDSFSCGYRAFILCRTFYNARDMNYTRDIDMSGVPVMDEVKKIQTLLTEVSTKAKIKERAGLPAAAETTAAPTESQISGACA